MFFPLINQQNLLDNKQNLSIYVTQPQHIPASSTKSAAFPVMLILPVSSQEEVLLLIYFHVYRYLYIFIYVKFRQFGAGFMCTLPEGAEVDFIHNCAHTYPHTQLRAGQEDNLPLTHTDRTMLIHWEPLNRFAN